MKTKTSKMILGAVLGATVLTNAYADKESCEKQKDKVWVASDKACIPENPCKADKDKYGKYCVRAFKDVQVPTEYDSDSLSRDYIILKTKNEHAEISCKTLSYSKIGQDYVKCKWDKNYKVFEFDDVKNTELSDEEMYKQMAKGVAVLCKAAGGQYKISDDNKTIRCKEIGSKGCSILSFSEERYKVGKGFVYADADYNFDNGICTVKITEQHK